MTLKEIVKQCEKEMGCNCDLDNWEPAKDTGHSSVCRINKKARDIFSKQPKEHILPDDTEKLWAGGGAWCDIQKQNNKGE